MSLFQKIDDVKNDYTIFPKSFKNYKWFNPILVFVVALIAFIILQYLPNILIIANVNIDFVTWGSILSSYMIIIYIPSIYISAELFVTGRFLHISPLEEDGAVKFSSTLLPLP